MANVLIIAVIIVGIAQTAAFIWLGLQIGKAAKAAKAGRNNVAATIILPVLQIVGLFFFVIGLSFGVYTIYFKSTALKTTGQITGFEHRKSKDGAELLAPTFAFTNQTGDRYEVTASIGSSKTSLRVGDTVSILYQPADPTSARLDTFLHNWLFPVLFGGLGGAMAVIATAVRIFRKPTR